ncbi:hypothetical protein Tco_0486726 [Tanacetum coccineum]
MAAFLETFTGSEGFHPVIDFLSQSHISYALTKKPEIYISFIKQFWRTAEASIDTDGEVTITAIIDGESKTITEASLRRHLKLEDHDGITSILNSEIFEQLALMGYQTDSDNDEGSLKLIELTNLVTKLSERIGILEDDLKQEDKRTAYSVAVTQLLLRVKTLEFYVQTGKARQKHGYASEVPWLVLLEGMLFKKKDVRRTERNDKGKAISTELEPKKMSKKEIEQEMLSFTEAIRLQEQMNEEQRAQIARDEEIARQRDEEERQRLSMEHGSEKMKSPKKIEEEDVDTQ